MSLENLQCIKSGGERGSMRSKLGGGRGLVNFSRPLPSHDFNRDQNGFRPKGLKARNAEFSMFSGVCMCLLNEPQMKNPLSRGVWGSPPPEIFWLLGSQVANGAFQCHFGSLYSNTPTPSPSKKIPLQIYTDLKNGPEIF